MLLDSTVYVRFDVTGTRSLREALSEVLVKAKTRVLALVTDQMAYHDTVPEC